MNNKRVIIKYSAMTAVLIASAVAALLLGSARLSPRDALCALFCGGSGTDAVIMRAVRLPRLCAAILAGSGLALSGTLLQSVTDNALASPNIIGVNSGAGFAMILMLCFFPSAEAFALPAAFLGALSATLITLATASKVGGANVAVLLSGMAISALLNAGISFVSLIDTDVVATYNYFSIGGISGVSLDKLLLPAVFIAASYIISVILAPRIQTLALGDSVAASLGVRVSLLRGVCIVCASASAAAAVSFAGLLGFVGLIAPHIVRLTVGERVSLRIIAAPIVGSSLVILADMLGRVLLAPTEIPVGIIMAALGAPFFLILLLRRKKHD